MTNSISPAPMNLFDLPPPTFPMVTRMVSNPIFPPDKPADTIENAITWVVSQGHPLVPKMHVVRMFISDVGVEIYSVSEDKKNGIRNFMPMALVRFVEEAMPLEVFINELEEAESENEDDDLEPEPEPQPAAVAAPSGQPVS